MAKKTFLTEEGLVNLEAELENLKTVRRKEIADKIKIAISFGDLSENSEYDEAKNEQAIVEARIAEIEVMLKNVKIIDESELSTEVVHVGSKVKIQNLNSDEAVEYKIVGASEANPTDGKISDDSPVGAALLGHKTGDVLDVITPIGVTKYKILEIYK